MLHIKQKNVYPADIQQFGQVCCCFVLLPWPACWSRMITLATFLKDYSNLRRVKYFLPLIDLFLYALPEKKKKLPVNKFHASGSEFDWEGLAQSTSSNLFKAGRTRSSMFETKHCYRSQQKLQFFMVQPIWIQLSARCSSFPSVQSFCSWP